MILQQRKKPRSRSQLEDWCKESHETKEPHGSFLGVFPFQKTLDILMKSSRLEGREYRRKGGMEERKTIRMMELREREREEVSRK